VNHSWTGASSSQCFIPHALVTPKARHAHRRAKLPGLCLLLARHRKRALEAPSAFATSESAESSTISPLMRLISASYHRSFVVSTAVIASPIQRHASSNWPSFAWALAKCDNHNGIHIVVPVDRIAVTPEVIV
jgi:hypothetical protein